MACLICRVRTVQRHFVAQEAESSPRIVCKCDGFAVSAPEERCGGNRVVPLERGCIDSVNVAILPTALVQVVQV